jgi:VanZ family protein
MRKHIPQDIFLLTCLSSFILILFIIGLWPFNFFQLNMVSQDTVGGLCLNRPAIVYTEIPPEKLLALKEFTILLCLSSALSDSRNFATIFGYSLDDEHFNFMIVQWRNRLVFKLNTVGMKGGIYFAIDNFFVKDKKVWIAIVCDGNKLSCYQDGEIKGEKITGPLNFSNWVSTYPLVIGSQSTGKSFWKGNIYSIGVFNQPLAQKEIKGLPIHAEEFSSLIYYSFTDSSGSTVTDHGKGQPANLKIPQYFRPYKRILLEKLPTSFNYYRHNLSDLIINIIGFIPFGFLLSIYLTRKGLNLGSTLILCMVFGFTISLTIEVVQAFLPSRSSDMIDIVTNTLGTAIGFFVCRLKQPRVQLTSSPMKD